MSRRRKPRLGPGKRFRRLELDLAQRPGVRNPRALAAYIGRRKYGKHKMAALSQAGRRRKR